MAGGRVRFVRGGTCCVLGMGWQDQEIILGEGFGMGLSALGFGREP